MLIEVLMLFQLEKKKYQITGGALSWKLNG